MGEWDEVDDDEGELDSLSLLFRFSFLSLLDGDGLEPVERYSSKSSRNP